MYLFIDGYIHKSTYAVPCHANDNYKKKLHAWEMTCGIPPERRVVILHNSIPDKLRFKDGLANKFVDTHTREQRM